MISERRVLVNNIIAGFLANCVGYVGYEYTKKLLDTKFTASNYSINKFNRI